MSTTFVNFFKLASPPQNLPQQGRRFRWNTGGRSVPVTGVQSLGQLPPESSPALLYQTTGRGLVKFWQSPATIQNAQLFR